MTITDPKDGDRSGGDNANGTDMLTPRGVKRRRIGKAASTMAPAILTLHSGRAWAASSCGRTMLDLRVVGQEYRNDPVQGPKLPDSEELAEMASCTPSIAGSQN
jgi:hypothetical protein